MKPVSCLDETNPAFVNSTFTICLNFFQMVVFCNKKYKKQHLNYIYSSDVTNLFLLCIISITFEYLSWNDLIYFSFQLYYHTLVYTSEYLRRTVLSACGIFTKLSWARKHSFYDVKQTRIIFIFEMNINILTGTKYFSIGFMILGAKSYHQHQIIGIFPCYWNLFCCNLFNNSSVEIESFVQ